MRVALVCPTVGQTRRGYERFMSDLFQVMAPELDVHLFKGGGQQGPRETVVRHIARNGLLARLLGSRLAYRRNQLEFASFAAMLLPQLRRRRFELVHVIDPQLLSHMVRMRRFCPTPFSLLFTHAGPAKVELWPWADHVHCLTAAAADEARAAGVPPERVSAIPIGIATERFAPPAGRDVLRDQWGVPRDLFTILCMASINRHHKRIDFLIEEVARLENNLLLWLDGGLHPDGDPSLLRLAAQRLGPRFRHTHVQSHQVGELFGLADVMVSASVHETFGMSIVEAMSAGVPVLVHNTRHFRALVGDGAHLLDMTKSGTVSDCLREMIRGSRPLRPKREPRHAVARFGWDVLRHEYMAMYQRAAATRKDS